MATCGFTSADLHEGVDNQRKLCKMRISDGDISVETTSVNGDQPYEAKTYQVGFGSERYLLDC